MMNFKNTVEEIEAILTFAGQLDGNSEMLSPSQREKRVQKYIAWNEKRERRTAKINFDITKNPVGFSETTPEKITKGADCSQDNIFPFPSYGNVMELKYLPIEKPEQFQDENYTPVDKKYLEDFPHEKTDNRETNTELEHYSEFPNNGAISLSNEFFTADCQDAELREMNDWRIKNGFQPLTLEDND